jgi:hypothetical protein
MADNKEQPALEQKTQSSAGGASGPSGTAGGTQWGSRKVADTVLDIPAGTPFRDRAGVELCKILLKVIGVVIFVVLVTTWLSELLNTFRSREAQQHVLSSITDLRADPLTKLKLGSALTALERIRAFGRQANTATAAPQADVSALVSVLEELASTEADPSRSTFWQQEKARFAKLQVAPSDARQFSDGVFETLAAQLKNKQSALPAEGAEHQRLTAARDLLKDIEVARDAERKHTISLAQLILVNVLLPLLTAMFGYIFGVNQTREGASGA